MKARVDFNMSKVAAIDYVAAHTSDFALIVLKSFYSDGCGYTVIASGMPLGDA